MVIFRTSNDSNLSHQPGQTARSGFLQKVFTNFGV